MNTDYQRLREVFLELLTVDGSHDRRRKDYNVAIFSPEGWAIWNRTELEDVMEIFDRAVKRIAYEDT